MMKNYIRYSLLLVACLSLLNTIDCNTCCPKGKGKFKNNFKYRTDDIIYEKNGIYICNRNKCYELTTCNLKQRYGGMFSRKERIANRTGFPYLPQACLAPRSEHQDETCPEIPSDGDACCKTKRHSTEYHGWVHNAYGDKVNIVCLRTSEPYTTCDEFQSATIGKCVPNSVCGYTNSPCQQEYTIQSFLAYKPGTPYPYLSFQPIQVPTYCSCKNTYP